ncbi:MAG: PLP-dependent aminotransferase family protein, partial [Spongiibacteraceae bacterium]|nr:PLP-dependent aminotransferase family protein [Spongiibacteraceae bacterium]
MTGNTLKQQRFPFEALIIDASAPNAMFRQLEQQLREAIWEGRLQAGERLPSSRRLAEQLNVARNTVVNAYEQLAMEGFICTSKGSGSRVTDAFPLPPKKNSSPLQSSKTEPLTPLPLSQRATHLLTSGLSISLAEASDTRPFHAHIPAYEEFPSDIWAQLNMRRLRQQDKQWLQKISPCGYLPLREAVAAYLGAARGLTIEPQQVVITAGAQQGIELLSKLLIDPADIACFEEPGYTPAANVVEMAGAKIVSIPVDAQGIQVDKLTQHVKRAKLIYVTPACHFPLGMSLSQPRRKALLAWAQQTGAFIIEDDYNGEFRYRGRPLTTLYAMSNTQRVIFMGSFSKLLFPSLRLGYLVLPHALVKPLATLRWFSDRHSPPLEQAVLCDFINQGHFARHLRRMRVLYVKRQQALLDGAKQFLTGILTVAPLDSGLHLLAHLEPGVSEQRLLAAAKEANVELT